MQPGWQSGVSEKTLQLPFRGRWCDRTTKLCWRIDLNSGLSPGHKHSLREICSDPIVTSKFSDTKAAGVLKTLEEFYKMLSHEPDRSPLCGCSVEKAAVVLAIDTLWISNKLFRHVPTRSPYVWSVDHVRVIGGNVGIFLALCVSGEQLTQLSGSGCHLTVPHQWPLGGRGRQQLWWRLIHRHRWLSHCVWDNIRTHLAQRVHFKMIKPLRFELHIPHPTSATAIIGNQLWSLSKCLDSVIRIIIHNLPP